MDYISCLKYYIFIIDLHCKTDIFKCTIEFVDIHISLLLIIHIVHCSHWLAKKQNMIIICDMLRSIILLRLPTFFANKRTTFVNSVTKETKKSILVVVVYDTVMEIAYCHTL